MRPANIAELGHASTMTHSLPVLAPVCASSPKLMLPASAIEGARHRICVASDMAAAVWCPGTKPAPPHQIQCAHATPASLSRSLPATATAGLSSPSSPQTSLRAPLHTKMTWHGAMCPEAPDRRDRHTFPLSSSSSPAVSTTATLMSGRPWAGVTGQRSGSCTPLSEGTPRSGGAPLWAPDPRRPLHVRSREGSSDSPFFGVDAWNLRRSRCNSWDDVLIGRTAAPSPGGASQSSGPSSSSVYGDCWPVPMDADQSLSDMTPIERGRSAPDLSSFPGSRERRDSATLMSPVRESPLHESWFLDSPDKERRVGSASEGARESRGIAGVVTPNWVRNLGA